MREISANRVLSFGTGSSALARFDRDVLMQPGVTHVIVLEAINDLYRGTASADARDTVGAENIIDAYQQMITRAHERGLVIFGATLTGTGGMNRPTSPGGRRKRRAINEWIRARVALSMLSSISTRPRRSVAARPHASALRFQATISTRATLEATRRWERRSISNSLHAQTAIARADL